MNHLNKTFLILLRKITIKDAVHWVAQAWDEIATSTLAKGWTKLLQQQDDTPDVPPDIPPGTSVSPNHTSEFQDLFQALGIRSDTDGEESPYNWLTEPIVDPGHQQLADNEMWL